MDSPDLAACSALGGALLTAGAQVGHVAVDVERSLASLRRRGGVPLSLAAQEGADLDTTATLLEGLGSALQRFCTEQAELLVLARDVERECSRWGLTVAGNTVRDEPGDARDEATRLEARLRLQSTLDALRRRERTCAGDLARTATRAGEGLRAVAASARGRS